ncbi:MAG: hypothetical protein LBL79_01500 [Prevotella sp.]|jgi:hypothetical protein|nr:hypothetical protein [Prevotella sp.]
MKKYLIIALISCLFASCASILNGDWTSVSVWTEQPVKAIVRGDTLHTKPSSNTNVLSFSVPRSGEPLRFVLQSDSLRKTINLSPKNSQNYYLNALYFWPGFLVDMSNPKRYTYDSKLTFDRNLNLYDGRFITRKGDLNFYFSLPFIYLSLNTISPEGHSRITRGSVVGLSAGFDYYYQKNKFINLTGSLSTSNISGCGYFLPYDWSGELLTDDSFVIHSLNMSHNHRLKRFSFGYGLSYSYTNYHKDEYSMMPYGIISGYNSNRSDYSYILDCNNYRYTSLGLVFNGYCYFSRYFSVGVIYKPNLLRLKSQSGNPFKYEHQITFDFAFRFSLLRGK